MLGAIYRGLTGLGAFAKALENISDNVSNVNTPGYRGKDLVFRDIYDQQGDVSNTLRFGNGVDTAGVMINQSQGNFRDTGVQTNAAIDGKGFFVLNVDGEYVFTRVGRFEFVGGVLVSSDSGDPLVGYDQGNQLGNIDVNEYLVSSPVATSTITMTGNLSRDADKYTASEIEIIDSLGEKHKLSIDFEPAGSQGQYTVYVKNEDGAVIALDDIRFDSDGVPIENFNKISLTYASGKGAEQKITIDFGKAGVEGSATNYSTGTESTLKASKIDGKEKGDLLKLTLENNGDVKASYSNGDEKVLFSVALAEVADLANIVQVDSSRFKIAGDAKPYFGKPSTMDYGVLKSGSLEMANVDITNEFADLVIVQRGYQASSQVLVTANEMLDNLIRSVNGGK